MMPSTSAFLLIALSATSVKATNTAGDPTDLGNWPPCSQKCVPIGLQAPTSCNSLSNRTCICRDPAFTLAIGDCEITSCSAEEATQIQELTLPLCSPVGGLAPDVVAAVSSFQAVASPVVAPSNLASYPATITANSVASAILATTTPLGGSDLGNGANIVDYPECAQFCGNQSVAVANCNVEELDCACGANYLSIAAACEQVTCSASDRAASQVLAEQFCGPLFQNFPSLGSAASAAVASATAVAASVASKDPTKIASYPICAQACQNSSTLFPTCGSLANRTCVCSLQTTDGSCEKATCSPADFQITLDLANSLCLPVGGFGDPYNASAATATAAPAPVASGDPTKSASYPLCAQKCQNASIPTTSCGSLANRTCLCTNATSSAMVGGCEIATCSASDLQITVDLANALCAPVGGFPNAYNASNRTMATPSPIAFAGNAIAVVTPWLGWIVIGLFGLVGWQALL